MNNRLLLAMLAGPAWGGLFEASAPAKVPCDASNIVPHDFASYSWPGHWFADFAGQSRPLPFSFNPLPLTSTGNATHPNYFSRDILDLIAKKTGSQPFVRVGGTSTYARSPVTPRVTGDSTSLQRPRVVQCLAGSRPAQCI